MPPARVEAVAQSCTSKDMRYAPEDRVDGYATAVRGLSTLEPDPERQLKYADFIDIYSAP